MNCVRGPPRPVLTAPPAPQGHEGQGGVPSHVSWGLGTAFVMGISDLPCYPQQPVCPPRACSSLHLQHPKSGAPRFPICPPPPTPPTPHRNVLFWPRTLRCLQCKCTAEKIASHRPAEPQGFSPQNSFLSEESSLEEGISAGCPGWGLGAGRTLHGLLWVKTPWVPGRSCICRGGSSGGPRCLSLTGPPSLSPHGGLVAGWRKDTHRCTAYGRDSGTRC